MKGINKFLVKELGDGTPTTKTSRAGNRVLGNIYQFHQLRKVELFLNQFKLCKSILVQT